MKRILFKAKIQGYKGYVYGVPHNVYPDTNQDYKWFDSMQYIDENGSLQFEYIESDTLIQLTDAEIEEHIKEQK